MNALLTIAQAAANATAAPTAPAAAPAAGNAPAAAPAADAANAAAQQGGFGSMIPFIIVIAAMFFLMWRGQAKEKKRREEMMNSIMVGTKVLTLGGIYGTVDSVNGDIFKIKIADNVKIEINRNGIASVIKDEKAAEPAAGEKK